MPGDGVRPKDRESEINWIDDFLDGTRCPDDISERIQEMWTTVNAMKNPLVTGVIVLDGIKGERKIGVTPDVMAGDTGRRRGCEGGLANTAHLKAWNRSLMELRDRDDAVALIRVMTSELADPDGAGMSAVLMHVQLLETCRTCMLVWEIIGPSPLGESRVYLDVDLDVKMMGSLA